MPIPEEIKRMRPKGLFKATEVRLISGHYYVYEISSCIPTAKMDRKSDSSG